MSRVLALLGCVAVVTTFVAYVQVLQQQSAALGEPPRALLATLQGAPTWFLAALAAATVADGAAVWMPAGRPRRLLLTGATVVLGVVGFLAIFSMGLPLLIAAGFSGAAARKERPAPLSRAPGADSASRSAG